MTQAPSIDVGARMAAARAAAVAGAPAWSNITGKPATFTPSAHAHVIADVTGLQTALDGKQVAGSYASASHSHIIADVTGLQTALDGKQAAGSYQPLDNDLTAIAALSTSAYGRALLTLADAAALTALGNTFTDVLKGLVPASGGGTSNFLRADGTWAAPGGGGSDPWTYIKLGSDYPTTLATWATVTGMSFTPAANTDYEVEWCLLCQTAVTTVGARPGISWGTGYEYGGVALYTPSSATAQTIVNGSINTAAGTAQAAVGGLPIINRSYAHYGQATFRSGTTPTAFNVQLASETAGTAVTAKAGSWLKYRTI